MFSITDSAPFEGVELPNQPEFSSALLADYTLQIVDWEVGLQAEYIYRSRQDLAMIVIPAEETLLEEDAYGLTNLRVIARPLNGRYTVTAFVNNATDESYRTSSRKDDLGRVYEIYAEPRIWGVRAEVMF